MRHRTTIIEHGPRRRWFRPWGQICRCGLDAWPCPAERMLEQQARMVAEARPARPPWNAPTGRYATGPLMTRGQQQRSGGHW